MRLWTGIAIAAMFAAPAMAQKSSTMSGVYTIEQAMRGQDTYLGNCKSCHTPESHAGPTFQSAWGGRPLVELYQYLRDRMPKSEPGSLSSEEYADILAYLLRLNRMPSGNNELAPDEKVMQGIRFETTLPVRKDR